MHKKPKHKPVTTESLTQACVVLRNLLGFKKACLKDSLQSVGNRPEDTPFPDLTDYELDLTHDIALLQAVRVMLYNDLRMMWLARGPEERTKINDAKKNVKTKKS